MSTFRILFILVGLLGLAMAQTVSNKIVPSAASGFLFMEYNGKLLMSQKELESVLSTKSNDIELMGYLKSANKKQITGLVYLGLELGALIPGAAFPIRYGQTKNASDLALGGVFLVGSIVFGAISIANSLSSIRERAKAISRFNQISFNTEYRCPREALLCLTPTGVGIRF